MSIKRLLKSAALLALLSVTMLAAPAFEVDEFVTAAKQRYPETRRYFDGLASVSQSMRWGIYQYAGRAIAALNDGGQL